ncbi:unnamed protein product, partial [Ascophyllum nodosum]
SFHQFVRGHLKPRVLLVDPDKHDTSLESLNGVLEPCFCCYHLDAKDDDIQGLLEVRG